MTDLDVFSAQQAEDGPTPAVPLDRSALLVVDMVNDFCTEGGTMVLPGSERLHAPITASAEYPRAQGGLVVWICDRHDSTQDEEFRKRTPHCLAGTWGAEIVDGLEPDDADVISPKHRYSAFHETDLHARLLERGVERLYLTGVVTNICVRSTAHDAFFLGYDVVVLEDGCAATREREQASSLYDIATHFGAVATSGQLLSGALCEVS